MVNNRIHSYTVRTALDEDYRFCQRIIQRHSKSFYYAFSRLPKPKANAVYAVYAFCRLADDAIDNEPSKATRIKNVEMLKEKLNRFLEEDINHPMWRALKDVFHQFPMNIQPFYDQLEGQKMDIHFRQPETMKDLETYSYYVAGSVGWMLLPILTAYTTDEVKQSAFGLGVAMQLTNVLRDVGEDYRDNKRIYLPKNIMKEEGYSEEKLQHGIIDDSFIRVWEQIAERSEELYDCFENDIFAYKAENQLPVLASAYVYRGILNEVRRQKYNCMTERQVVSALKKERLYKKAKQYLDNI